MPLPVWNMEQFLRSHMHKTDNLNECGIVLQILELTAITTSC